jgi:hypothetical protein
MLNRTAGLDQELNSVSIEAQLLFVMTIPHLDRDGLIIGEPLPHLGVVLPLRPDFFSRYEQLTQELVDCGIVIRYPTKKGRVLFFPGFRKNQTFTYSREAASVYDAPPGYVRIATGLTQDTDKSNALLDHDLLMTNSGVDHDQNSLKLSKDKISQVKPTHDDDFRGKLIGQWEAVLGMFPTASYPEAIGYMDRLKAGDALDWWGMAITETVDKAKRPSWQYMKAILEGWLAAGKPSVNGTGAAKDPDNRPRVKAPPADVVAAADARQAAYERQVAEQLARAGRLA